MVLVSIYLNIIFIFLYGWAFVLAVVAILDAWILGCLAFTLAHRHAKPLSSYGGPMHISESPYMNPGSIYKGKMTNNSTATQLCNLIIFESYVYYIIKAL